MILLTALALTACTSKSTGLLDPESLYPKALTFCADEPVVTTRKDLTKPRTAREKAGITQDYHDAWQDCHGVVNSWAERRTLYEKQYTTETEDWFSQAYHGVTGVVTGLVSGDSPADPTPTTVTPPTTGQAGQ